MADAPKLQVLKALTRQIETVTVVNGYSYNLNGKVYRGRSVIGAEADAPMASLIEDPRPDFPITTDNNIAKSETWLLHLQAWVKDDKLNPLDEAYQIGFDIDRCLARVIKLDDEGRPKYEGEYYLGLRGLIADINFGPGVARAPVENVSPLAFYYLPIRIKLAYDVGA